MRQEVLEPVWEMRENLTAYDAVYVALAEILDARLLTCDRSRRGGEGGATCLLRATPEPG
jgi:hypothetical protein